MLEKGCYYVFVCFLMGKDIWVFFKGNDKYIDRIGLELLAWVGVCVNIVKNIIIADSLGYWYWMYFEKNGLGWGLWCF